MAYQKLKEDLTKLADGGLCVAFSGGVDSAVLLKAACEVCENVHAVTLATPFHSPPESKQAEETAKNFGAKFKLIQIQALPDEIMQNPPERCYLCKKEIFTAICEYASQNGLHTVLDGTNADDLGEYRPGLRALAELDVKSPLAGLGITKSQVRAAARELGLTFAERPSAPCLATRIPYNTRIEPLVLEKIDEIETFIKSLGVDVVRARIHGDTVRIEAVPEMFHTILENREAVLNKAKSLGFLRVALDIAGFKSGSFDNR